MDIRARSDDDLDDLVAVAARVHEADGYPLHLPDGDHRRFLTRPPALAAWVAVADGRAIGHAALNETTSRPVMALVADHEPSARPVYVARLLVDPAARRRGVGRALLDEAARAAVASWWTPFLDVVDTPSAAPAIALYRRAGWEQIGRCRFELVGRELDELVFRAPAR